MKTLIFVLGDQLTPTVSSLAEGDRSTDVVLMAEVDDETAYVPHHKKKLAFVFSAMRHFAKELAGDGWRVDYHALDQARSFKSLGAALQAAVKTHKPDRIIVTEPSEWRVREMIDDWRDATGVPIEVLADNRFLCSSDAFANWAEGRKQLRMEYFYRDMRRRTGLLMDGDKPAGGKWNFDSDNRKPAKQDLFMPRPLEVRPDTVTNEVLELVERRFSKNFGALTPFWFAVTRADAERAFDRFVAEALPSFGDYQDAMLTNERFLYHSVVSLYINVGLLDPMDVCRKVEAEYRAGRVPLNSAEGFVRQIIGWREYVRGIYWLKMPGYVGANVFGHKRPLPDFYWTGETDMACLRACITQTREEAYAHHIQRLMVTGNFVMLAGVDPRAVHEWYLAVYADAFEWVELPNTLGMSQFADGGLLASKPYAASGNYINKMSDYCAACRYDVKEKTSENACPFNALYWDFLARNDDVLRGNPRLGPVYRTWDRMSEDKRGDYRKRAATVLRMLD